MDVQDEFNAGIQMAHGHNQRVLRQTLRLLWIRLAVLTAFLLIATTAILGYRSGVEDLFWLIIPSIGLSLIFLVLALDAWGQSCEIRGRRWRSITPRFPSKPPTDEQGNAGTTANVKAV